jgi:hypothetical protein
LLSGGASAALSSSAARAEAERAKQIYEGPSGVSETHVRLLTLSSPEDCGAALDAIAQMVHKEKRYDKLAAVFEKVIVRGDPETTLFVGSLLVKIMEKIPPNALGTSRDAESFPDDLPKVAVQLMQHSHPAVQALGEWALSLRIKKQDAESRDFAKMYQTAFTNDPIYLVWKQRGPEHFLTDDYFRQLAMLYQHLSVQDLQQAMLTFGARMQKVRADSRAVAPSALWKTYEQALARMNKQLARKDLAEALETYPEVRLAAREVLRALRADFPNEGAVFFTNPSLPGGDGNVNVVVTGNTNPPKGDIYKKSSADPAAPAEPMHINEKLGQGALYGIDLEWEGGRVVFSHWAMPTDDAFRLGYRPENAQLYLLDLTNSAISRIMPESIYDDVEPIFLPDGGYIFSSSRASYGNQCAGPILQNKRCTTLFRWDPRRSSEPVAISNNKDFDRHASVLNDGSVAFLHWEYQERGLYHSHNVWRCRPDGTGMDAYYKQHISAPMSIRTVRQVPGSDWHVATAQGHHDGCNGPLILFNPSQGINNEAAMKLVSPGVSDIEGGFGPLNKQVVPEGGIQHVGGSYATPFPLSEKTFLASCDLTGAESEFALYYVDVYGNMELIHRDRDGSIFGAMALRPRTRPPIVADMIRTNETYATAFVDNVYADLPGVERGTVKYLRMSQSLMLPAPVYGPNSAGKNPADFNHLHYLPGDATTRHFGYWSWSPVRTIGFIPVNDNGSAYFKVPAGIPVYLQALDGNFMEVRRMRTSFTLQRGEFRSCAGCHETRQEAAAPSGATARKILAQGPVTPQLAPWGELEILDYRQHIQPIFDKHCISCHGESSPAGGLDLTSREIGGFAQSFRALFGLKPKDPTPINELDWHLVLNPTAKNDKYITDRPAVEKIRAMQSNAYPGQLIAIADRIGDASITLPYQFGSAQSALTRKLLDDRAHFNIRKGMSTEEWLMLVTWIDYNALYHSTVFDVRPYQSRKTFMRVPYQLPSAWLPGDINPTFFNPADNNAISLNEASSARDSVIEEPEPPAEPDL